MAGKTFLAFPAHGQPAILRIWQEAHASETKSNIFFSIQKFQQQKKLLKYRVIKFYHEMKPEMGINNARPRGAKRRAQGV